MRSDVDQATFSRWQSVVPNVRLFSLVGALTFAGLLVLGAVSTAQAAEPRVSVTSSVSYNQGGDGGSGMRVLVQDAPACRLPDDAEASNTNEGRGVRVSRGSAAILHETGIADPTPEGENWADVVVLRASRNSLIVNMNTSDSETVNVACKNEAGDWETVATIKAGSVDLQNFAPVDIPTLIDGATFELYEFSYNAETSSPDQMICSFDGVRIPLRQGSGETAFEGSLPSGVTPGLHTMKVEFRGGVIENPVSVGFDPTLIAVTSTTSTTSTSTTLPTTTVARQTNSVFDPIVTPSELKFDLKTLGLSVGMAGAVVIIVGMPAELFNKTVETNAERIGRAYRRWTRRLRLGRRRRPPVASSWSTLAGFCVFSALLSALASPTVDGLNSSAYYSFISFVVATPLVLIAYAYSAEAYARSSSGVRFPLRILKWSPLLAVVLAVISRLCDFHPGYYYGLIMGFIALTPAQERERRLAFAANDKALDDDARRQESRSVLAGFIATMAIGAVAFGAMDAFSAHTTKWYVELGRSVTTGVFVMSVQTLLFGLLPLKFMDGAKVLAWRRWQWVTTFVAALTTFFYIIVWHPEEGAVPRDYGHVLRRSCVVFAIFAVASLLFWAWFRYTSPPLSDEDDDDDADDEVSADDEDVR